MVENSSSAEIESPVDAVISNFFVHKMLKPKYVVLLTETKGEYVWLSKQNQNTS